MIRKNRTPLIIIIGFILVGGLMYATSNTFPNADDPYFEGNVRQFSLTQLALIQDTGNMDCDAWNQISISFDDGSRTLVASGSEGLAPFIDSSVPLDLVKGGKGVQKVHFEFALECDGDAMDGTTIVQGGVQERLCGDPAYDTTTCILGSSGGFTQIYFKPFTFSSQSLQPGVKKVLFSHDYSEAFLLGLYDTGNGKIHFKHEVYPQLTFSFIHPTAGSFTGSYDAFAENDIVIAQYGLIENTNFAPPVDTDGDGINDNDDQCPTQKETVNGFMDSDGCPDTVPGEEDTDEDGIKDSDDQCPNDKETYNGYQDTDGCPDINPSNKQLRITQWFPKILDIANDEDTITIELGIQNLESNESIPNVQITKQGDTFVKDTFTLPTACTKVTLGWNDCIFAVGLDMNKYPKGSYDIKLHHQVRNDIVVEFSVIDTTPTVICGETNACPDPDPVTDPIDVITDFFDGEESTTTTTGVKITRSNSSFGEFGQEDMLILLVLMGIVIGVALLARLKKKGK